MGHLTGHNPQGIITQSPTLPFSQPSLASSNLVPDALLFLLPVLLIFALMFGLCCTFWFYVLRATRRIEAELESGSGRHSVAKCDGMRKMTYKKKWLKKATLKSDACAICLEDFMNKVEISLCICGHAYHHKCIIKWMEIKDTCPICQRCVRGKRSSRETAPLLRVGMSI